jgi:DNA-binding Xre family transcriptional regulator
MDETRQIVGALKRVLKSRELTYQSLGRRINLSEASVKRVFAQRTFSLKRLEQICRALDMSMADLVRTVDHKDYRTTTLGLEQEAALAKDPVLFSYFCLLLNGLTDQEIRRHYEFEEPQTRRLFGRLVELELAEELPKKRHRLRVVRQIQWRRDGPIRRAYERQVHTEFLRSSFEGSNETLRWQPVELTDSSIDVLQRKLAQLHREFLEMAELDLYSNQAKRSTALLLAFRPWVFSLVASRRRRSTPRAWVSGL